MTFSHNLNSFSSNSFINEFIDQPPFKSFKDLLKVSPYFLLNGEQIRPLQEPHEFYEELKAQIRAAKFRIVLAALYIGHSEKELVDTLKIAVKQSKQLKVHILLDCMRATRIGQTSLDKSPACLLLPLVKEFPDQVTVSLYHTPDLTGILKQFLPPRFNEGIGLMHIKSFIFDHNLMLSGANLNHDYFINRQDRYMLFERTLSLTSYFADLVETIASFSYTLKPTKLIDEDSYKLVLTNQPDPVTQSTLFRKSSSLIMKNFIKKWMRRCIEQINNTNSLQKFDTVIFPVIQMCPLSIRQDELATLTVLDAISRQGIKNNVSEDMFWKVFFTSGYFNFTQKYKEKILNAMAKFQLLSASPEANGFFSSKGISKHLPQAYTLIEKQFFSDICRHGKEHLIKIQEYKRPGWTFHAKGLWCYIHGESWPSLTIIGSSNYGYRSTERDLEAQAILITNNIQLRKKIHEELEHISEYTEEVTKETFQKSNRKVPYLVRVATRLIKTML
ncbi:9627_t:CDS:2 [Funneliformis mosseae]|uniref:CDP-diacylglycerol--glycerol-3-phosphate 3-phosphatidyltransferase n=1 Tax=Funneliformis mosseae TaxID=27381 RepID=A0A9N9ALJ9_FUNMO|nr:9627_t:CDS:2 [Funneliformis mosseae]